MNNYNLLTTKEFYEELLPEEFPELYKFQDYEHGFCGTETGPGWHNIIYALSKTIYPIIMHDYGNTLETIYVQQIKEKFGTLRFYMSLYDQEIEEAIRDAEFLSGITCEECGSEIQTGFTNGWITCLCYKCASKEKRIVKDWKQTTSLIKEPDTWLNGTFKEWTHFSYVFCLDWDSKTVNKVFREYVGKSYTYYGTVDKHAKKKYYMEKPPRRVLKEMKMRGFKINPKAWEIIDEGSSKSRKKRF